MPLPGVRGLRLPLGRGDRLVCSAFTRSVWSGPGVADRGSGQAWSGGPRWTCAMSSSGIATAPGGAAVGDRGHPRCLEAFPAARSPPLARTPSPRRGRSGRWSRTRTRGRRLLGTPGGHVHRPGSYVMNPLTGEAGTNSITDTGSRMRRLRRTHASARHPGSSSTAASLAGCVPVGSSSRTMVFTAVRPQPARRFRVAGEAVPRSSTHRSRHRRRSERHSPRRP
jgi:hypothetical protein